MHERWKRAVVHLEAATDSQLVYDRIRRMQEVEASGLDQVGALREAARLALEGSRDIRFHGTALFLKHDGRHFLITARHVLYDEMRATLDLQEEVRRLEGAPGDFREAVLASARQRARERIFGIIFRVPSLDELQPPVGEGIPRFLMNLGAGVSWLAPYTFSEPDVDLAVVSLDSRDRPFTDELLARGYLPVTLEDIGDGPSEEGAEVLTVGYPLATAALGELNLAPAIRHWSSAFYSLPTFAFGRVSMLHAGLNYFWCDVSVYPGNSGGPVIERDRVVGVVSEQAAIEATVSDQDGAELPLAASIRIPFAKAIKAEHIRPVIEQQLAKDGRRS